MQSASPKNIQNIAVHIDLAQRKVNSNSKPDSKYKIQIKLTPSTKIKFQRNLSPWNRKKDQLRGRTNSINDEPNLQIVTLRQKQIHTNQKNQSTINNQNEQKMSDFLQKIHFTNKKINSSQRKTKSYQTNNFQYNQFIRIKSSQKQQTHDLTGLTKEDIRTIIIYPKDPNKNDFKSKNNLKDKNKHTSTKKIASIQNFYDPYQNQTKINRKMLKYRLKLNDQLSHQADTTRLNETAVSYQQFQTTWRKNTVPQKFHKRNFSMPQNQIYLSKNFKDPNQKQMRTTFFKTRTSNLSRNFKTQPTQRNQHKQEDPQKYHSQDQKQNQQKSSPFEPTYATPSGQAIKRIKHQYKKSRKIKTQQNNYRSQHSKSQIQAFKRQNHFYLYQTFLNYKSKKDSSGMNITKTLGFNFHNQKTFKNSIQKVLLKSKN